MVLIRILCALTLVAASGCGKSLFDNNDHADAGGGGGDDANIVVPTSCPETCLADLGADFDGTAGGTGNHWRYFDDHRDRTWSAMTAASGDQVGANPANKISSCDAHPGAPGCVDLPGAVLVSTAGATSPADPAAGFTATTAQVIQLSVIAEVASGDHDQVVRLYRNSREDVLYTATAGAGVKLSTAVVVDALPGDRFFVVIAPSAMGATDVALHFFVSATGAVFPATCQLGIPFSTAAGNTVANACGGAPVTHFVDSTRTMTPPVLGPGPFPELGPAADIAFDTDYETAAVLNKTGDTTVQLWFQFDTLYDSTTSGWLFSDIDLNNAGGLGILVYDSGTQLTLEVITCTSVTPITYAYQDLPITPGTTWRFVRVVHTNGAVKVCVDGAQVASFPVAAGKLKSTFAPYIGKNVLWLPVGAFLDGHVDDVRVFSGALPCQ